MFQLSDDLSWSCRLCRKDAVPGRDHLESAMHQRRLGSISDWHVVIVILSALDCLLTPATYCSGRPDRGFSWNCRIYQAMS
jgi:hypothetical protein